MPYEIYGKTSLQCGKTLWEILGNLKNHGVGRIVVRNQFKRYPEPSWYRILKVETVAPEVSFVLLSFPSKTQFHKIAFRPILLFIEAPIILGRFP